MYSIQPNERVRYEYCKYLIGGVILYLPLMISNILILNTMNDLYNLVDTPENIEYIDKIKYLINQACQMMKCSED